ncbi:phosphoglucomutase-2 [Brienomyrus brachyistius]|uniref:phosphoglucomutase-2 n=1 Tax=Brienomyrus brachyistius TaxID=42636 RepID=UPI0020B33D5A|nr:phosphoglucomutase-2 [Brienomyrus brachyistius]
MEKDVSLDHEIKEWLRLDKNPKTLSAVRSMQAEGAKEKLRQCFGARMEFGTAGLRAAMGPGISCMNDLTIIQTTQGFCRYLEKSFPDLKDRGVVIGYDARAHPSSGGCSKRFATLAAAVMISQGVPVYLFGDITPTPFVPFTVSHLGLCAGIMVTASHNPKEDNGYKVYWENGAQIIPPHDKEISRYIEQNLEPWDKSWDEQLVKQSPLLRDRNEEISREYFETIRELCFHRDTNKSSKLKFVHTSVHGVGHAFVQSAFKAFDLPPPLPVEEQKDPDPEFPTVKYPNPEEGEGVLTLSFELADKEGATVILANDPDADRLAVAEKQQSGKWRVFSGNELGALLGWWLFRCWKLKNPETAAVKNIYMLSSTVSSKILRALALKEGFHFEETLTGFKWMGNRAKQLLENSKTVLFAFEEAIGYMCSPAVLDKDGVSAAAIVAECASYLCAQGSTLTQQLDTIYEKYGHHITSNSYFICHDQDTIRQLFERLRNYDGKDTYPKSCGKFTVSGVRDLTTGYDSSQPDKKAVLPISKSSQMITFSFSNGGVATMRTSGTEPKIKYYAELCAAPGNSDLKQLKDELGDLVDAIVNFFFEPEKNKLSPRLQQQNSPLHAVSVPCDG